jgi:hypothetical protein
LQGLCHTSRRFNDWISTVIIELFYIFILVLFM